MYLEWEGTEIATKAKRGKLWKCYCGHKEAAEYFMHLHLEIDHKIINAILRQDDENYDGRKLK